MERLTFEGMFCDIAMCQEIWGGERCPNGYCSQKRVWERLREYEETGLSPSDILAGRYKDDSGRLVYEELADKIESVSWYSVNESGELCLGAKSEDVGWYRAGDILDVLRRFQVLRFGAEEEVDIDA